ncbi:hypothetical protein [Uliginosibacterium sp. 31-12]|uniref:hypothetical protein n=1 Tax=Uliginosibacterium sp. 31-12 TaxID=3062781 RepID=UPI0026E24604|nr:hypothetical protein [Uliginosibacterium sp. 31-12]MDO6385155.1 hypothetical protein [Uliginosibacterium sp. 31-12]
MMHFDLVRPVFVEAESRKIFTLFVPATLIERIRAALCIETSREARVEYLLRDYAWLGKQSAELAQKQGFLKGLQAKETLSHWQDWALARALSVLYTELIDLHYYPLYTRSQNRNFTRFPQAQRCKTNDLSTAGIEQLAASILKHSEHS